MQLYRDPTAKPQSSQGQAQRHRPSRGRIRTLSLSLAQPRQFLVRAPNQRIPRLLPRLTLRYSAYKVDSSSPSRCRYVSQELNPSNANTTFVQSTRTHRFKKKTSNPCHVGIYRIALAECSHMSTHMSSFQSFSRFLHHFVVATTLATSSIRVKGLLVTSY